MTDTIDPALVPGELPLVPPSGGEPAPPGEGSGTPPVDEAPETSRLVATLVGVALVVVIVMWAGWWGLAVVAGLVLSIVLHEFGHYLTAKQAGMKVTEFFIGFGPKIVSFRRGETEYGIKPLPLGAYVKIIGMNDMEDVEPGDEGRTYREKGYWARLRVVLAGPFTNLALAILLILAAMAIFSQPSDKGWKVDKVVAASAAAQAGLRKGDQLVSVDGQPVGSFDTDFVHAIESHAGQPVTLVVDRAGQRVVLHPTIRWQLNDDGATALAPMEAGDQIVSIGGQAVSTYDQTRTALAHAPSGSTKVEFVRNGNTYATTVPTPLTLPASGGDGFLGISAQPRFHRLGPVQVVTSTFSTFGSIVTGSISSLGHFFAPSNLSSYVHYVATNKVTPATGTNPNPAPITTVTKGAPTAEQSAAAIMASPANNRLMSIFGVIKLGSQEGAMAGVLGIVMLLALINVFLGLLNLVPLLPFDGGHAAVATYEAIREKRSGRPYRANVAKLLPVTYAVMIFLGFIFLSTTYLDLFHPVHLPGG